MASLRLNTIPLAGLRPILSYVDLKSLIKLYATFDRKIQTMLSSPNALADLCIKAARGGILVAPYRYFIGAIRSVHCLKVESDAKWAPTSISLLQTLNPRKLVIGAGFLHPSVRRMLSEAQQSPSDPILSRLAQNFSSNATHNFPTLNFAILTV